MSVNNVQTQQSYNISYNTCCNKKNYQNSVSDIKSNTPENGDTVSFTSAEGNRKIKVYETEGSTGKKWGVGIASFCLPGLGQAINGEWGKGIALCAGFMATGILSLKSMAKGRFPALGYLTALAIKAGSIIDAVKNAKSEIRVIE